MIIKRLHGIYTNVDPNDVKLDYLSKAKNIRVSSKSTNTQFYNSTEITIPAGITQVLGYYAIEFDNDKLQSDVVEDEIIPTYKYEVDEKYLLIGNDNTKTRYFIDGKEIESPIKERYNSIRLVEDQGKVLILTGSETLWLGKLKRNLWFNDKLKNIDGIFIDRYLEPFNRSNLGVATDGDSYKCKANRRLGFQIEPEIIIDGSIPLFEDDADLTYLATEENENSEIVVGSPGPTKFMRQIYRCRNKTTGEIIYNKPELALQVLQKAKFEYHTFLVPENNPAYRLVPRSYFKDENGNVQNFKLEDGEDPDSKWQRVNSIEVKVYKSPLGGVTATNSNGYFLIHTDEIEELKLVYIGEATIETQGFEASQKDYELLVTSILDNKEEIVTEYLKGSADVDNSRYGIRIKTTIPNNVNKRLTGIRYYIRFNEVGDFKEVKDFNLISSEKVNNLEFVFGKISANGVELIQRIGILFDKKTYSPIANFDFFRRIAGFPYVVSNNQVYGAIAGSGQVLDLFYPENYIPDITERKIKFLTNLNGIPAVHDLEKTILIIPGSSGFGTIEYQIRDTIGFAIKSEFDIATSPDGIAIHTKEGIFGYNGNTLIPLSKQIDDIVEKNFETGSIFFNSIGKDLFYFRDTTFDEFYRYSFVDKEWTTHELPKVISIKELQSISIDFDGSLLIVTDNIISKLKKTEKGIAEVKTHYSDLGRPRELKSFIAYRFDFIGVLEFNNRKYQANSRTAKTIPIPLHLRIPAEKISIALKLYDNSELFSIELVEETIGEVDPFMEKGEEIEIEKPQDYQRTTSSYQSIPEVPFELHLPMIGNVTANQATAKWYTTQLADTKVMYGLTPETMVQLAYNNTMTRYHDIILMALDLEENYWAQLFSTNEDGITIFSEPMEFFTNKEVTLQNIFSNPNIQWYLTSLNKKQSTIEIGELEQLLTLLSDAEDDLILNSVNSTHSVVSNQNINTLGTDFDTSVMP